MSPLPLRHQWGAGKKSTAVRSTHGHTAFTSHPRAGLYRPGGFSCRGPRFLQGLSTSQDGPQIPVSTGPQHFSYSLKSQRARTLEADCHPGHPVPP